MRKMTIRNVDVDNVKVFLLKAGKQIYDTGKRIYYVDYNDNPCKLTRG